MAIRKKHTIRINRRIEPGRYVLPDIFTDIRSYGVLLDVFADREELDRVLGHTSVLVVDQPHVMSVDNDSGSIKIGLAYFRSAPDEYLYLDIIHELCHVKQHLDGRNLYDRHKSYVDRDTEIEAYRVTVQEARRLGLTESVISDYLYVPWITPEEHRRLVRRMGGGRSAGQGRRAQPTKRKESS